jgi:hypothetical protein
MNRLLNYLAAGICIAPILFLLFLFIQNYKLVLSVVFCVVPLAVLLIWAFSRVEEKSYND